MRVLVADDDFVNRKFLEKIFKVNKKVSKIYFI